MYCVSWCEIAHIDNWLLRPDILKGGDAGGFQTVGHIPLVGNRSTVDGVQLTMEKYGVELNRINVFFEEKINKKKPVSWCCHADQYFDKIQLGFFLFIYYYYFSCSWMIKKNVENGGWTEVGNSWFCWRTVTFFVFVILPLLAPQWILNQTNTSCD